MSFSLVILHHDKSAYSRACLESVLRCSARPLQIVNVDNGSTDQTPQVLKWFEIEATQIGLEVETLRFETNIGAVRGRNQALKVARGEFIAFLDNDTLIAQSDWLEKLGYFLEFTADCAVVAPKLLFPGAPHDIECCGAAVSPRGKIQYLGRGQARGAIDEKREIQCAISAAWLMRREVVDQIGALDEAFSPVQYEDLDFCYRARAAGWTIWCAPDVEVFHFEHTTTAGSGDINFAYVTAKNGVLFKKRWGATFALENGPSEEEAGWQNLPKTAIENIDWRALLPGDLNLNSASGANRPEICKQSESP